MSRNIPDIQRERHVTRLLTSALLALIFQWSRARVDVYPAGATSARRILLSTPKSMYRPYFTARRIARNDGIITVASSLPFVYSVNFFITCFLKNPILTLCRRYHIFSQHSSGK